MLHNLIGKRDFVVGLVFAASVGCLTAVSSAQLSITSYSSTAQFNLPGAPGNLAPGQPVGMYYLDRNNPGSGGVDWLQDMSQTGSKVGTVTSAGKGQWWWIGIDGVAGGAAQSLDTLGYVANSLNVINVPNTLAALSVAYGTGNVQVNVASTLNGTGVGGFKDTMTHQIQLFNNGASPVNVRLYGFSNFDLTQIHTTGTTFLPDATSYNQAAVSGNSVTQKTLSAAGKFISGVTLTAPGSGFAGIEVNDAQTLFNELNGGLTGSLNFANSSILGTNPNQDPAFAYQYNLTIPAGGSQTVNDLFTITPEPASLMLLVVGGLLVGARPRRHA